MFTLTYKFSFSAAHHLKDTPSLVTKKCLNVHGHTWTGTIIIKVKGLLDDMVVDFSELKEIIKTYDHSDLNTLFENPTAERISEDIADKIEDLFRAKNFECHNIKVEVNESPNSSIIVEYD